jgi:hypothetical protein
MPRLLHRTAALAAIALIAVFFASTIVVELLADPETIARLKSLILVPGLLFLIPALAATGIAGNLLARGARGGVQPGPGHQDRAVLLRAKSRRMAMAAANGLLVLVPCAIVLDRLASQGAYDWVFALVQGIELAAGALNLSLLGLNFRDGLRLARGGASRAPLAGAG